MGYRQCSSHSKANGEGAIGRGVEGAQSPPFMSKRPPPNAPSHPFATSTSLRSICPAPPSRGIASAPWTFVTFPQSWPLLALDSGAECRGLVCSKLSAPCTNILQSLALSLDLDYPSYRQTPQSTPPLTPRGNGTNGEPRPRWGRPSFKRR